MGVYLEGGASKLKTVKLKMFKKGSKNNEYTESNEFYKFFYSIQCCSVCAKGIAINQAVFHQEKKGPVP